MALDIKDGGMSSAVLRSQLIAGEHMPFQNVLGSVGITNSLSVSIIGPSSVAVTNPITIAAGVASMGTVNVGGGNITVLSMPAVQVTRVQFGLSSVVVGQQAMGASMPMVLSMSVVAKVSS